MADIKKSVQTALEAVTDLNARETTTRQATKTALEAVTNHEGRIKTREGQPNRTTTDSPASDKANKPNLQANQDVPDLPNPTVHVVPGGLVVDRVQRMTLSINQLGEVDRNLDLSPQTPISGVSIPPHPRKFDADITPEERNDYREVRGFCRIEEIAKPMNDGFGRIERGMSEGFSAVTGAIKGLADKLDPQLPE